MDTAEWEQEMGIVKDSAEVGPTACSMPTQERKVRPQKDKALICRRCNSTSTKFCYYNNYSLTQPRYFCKTCRRYWTEGGSLRNVPVGGGSRKNKRSSTSSSHKLPDLNPQDLSHFSSQNPKTHEAQDLNLPFPATQHYHGLSQFLELPKIENNNTLHFNSSSSSFTSTPLSGLELLRNGVLSRELNSFIPTAIPDSSTKYPSGFPFQEFKPAVGFVDGLGTRYGGVQENGNGRLMFPFGVLAKEISSTSEVDHNKGEGNSTGYWNGMFGGGSW